MDPRLQQIIDMNKKEEDRRGYPTRAKDVPVTQKMLYLVRDELKSSIQALDLKISSGESRKDSLDSKLGSLDSRMDSLDSKLGSLNLRMDSLDSKLGSLDLRMDSLDSKLSSLDSRIDSLDSKLDCRFDKMMAEIHGLKSEIHRIALISEEQNAKNNIVLDGLTSLFARQERIEARMDACERAVK